MRKIIVSVYATLDGYMEPLEQLFKNATDIPYLQLVDTKPFNTGIVILTYQPTEGR